MKSGCRNCVPGPEAGACVQTEVPGTLSIWFLPAHVGAIMFLSVPRHDEPTVGFSASAHAALEATNRVRTDAWTARAVLALTMVADAMRAS